MGDEADFPDSNGPHMFVCMERIYFIISSRCGTAGLFPCPSSFYSLWDGGFFILPQDKSFPRTF